MANKDFKALAEELREYIGATVEGAAVDVYASIKTNFKDGAVETVEGEYDAIVVRPINGCTIYTPERICEFGRYHGLSQYVTVQQDYDKVNHTYAQYICWRLF